MSPIRIVFSQFLTSESKKDLIQKRKKEKLPVDIVPSSEPTLDKCEQVAAVEMDLSPTETANTEAPLPPPAKAVNSTQGLCTRCHKLNKTLFLYEVMAPICIPGSQPEPRPAKCVKISGDEPVVIPNPR